MVTATLARLPDPRAVTISSGIWMPVAVLPSCRIVVWNRMTSALVLEHRDDIAGRVLEPGDRRSLRATRDPLLVLLEVGIPLHPDPGRDEAVDGGIDIGHR